MSKQFKLALGGALIAVVALVASLAPASPVYHCAIDEIGALIIATTIEGK